MLTTDEIDRLIRDDAASELKLNAEKGERYYDGLHDILNMQIYSYNADGVLERDKFKSNIRISHPFFTEIVDQQVQYMLSGDGSMVRTDIPELQSELDGYFGEDFRAELYDLLTSTVVHGFGYMYANKDDEGRVRFGNAGTLGVVEVRKKDTDSKIDCVIYWYVERVGKDKKRIKRVQVWDANSVYFYVAENDGGVKLDEEIPLNPRPHIMVQDPEGKLLGKGFGFIPFWRLDNSSKRVSGLATIKSLIDDYDLMACSLSNNLQDFQDALYVVKGYPGQNMDELVQNIKAKKHIGVDEGGDVEIKTIDIPYSARTTKLELDEKNIYRFGMGFNSAQVGDGNVTNVVIKSRYALLDLKCNKLEIRLRRLMRKLVKVVIDEINQRDGTAYDPADVYFVFDREVMTNAADNAQIELTYAQTQQAQVNTLLSVAGALGDDTTLQNICDVLELDYEKVKAAAPKDGLYDNAEAQAALNE